MNAWRTLAALALVQGFAAVIVWFVTWLANG